MPAVVLSRTQRVGQTVGHFSYATDEVSVQEVGRLLLRAEGSYRTLSAVFVAQDRQVFEDEKRQTCQQAGAAISR